MAFLKKAYAAVTHPNWGPQNWMRFVEEHRAQMVGRGPYRTAAGSPNLAAQASEILGQEFDPKKFLLTHATIVASVDTDDVPNVRLGAVSELGRKVNRKWANFRVTPQTDIYINNNCFVPGTLITMADGTVKPIEDVREGDEVLTHLGRTRRVRAVMCREVDEEIFEIHPRATTERVYATGEHPFFVFRENACANCGVPARSKSSYNARCVTHLIGKFYCSSQCWYEKRVRKAQLLAEKTGEFVEARHLTDRDFTSTPVLTETSPVGLTLGQARLIGLFVAEGYYELDSRNDNERVGAMWALHSAEAPTLAKTVCDLMRAEFGVECVVRDHNDDDLGIHVTTRTNRDAAAFFSRWVLGDGSTTKTLHPDLLRAEKDVQMEIVRGWMEGDGCLQDTATDDVAGDVRLTGSTASRSLANQMQIVLRRLGVSSRLTRTETPGRSRLVVDGEPRIVSDESKPRNVSWAVACGGAWIDELVQETVYEEGYLRAVEHREGLQQAPALRFLNGYELQIIQSVDRVAYSGPVYNFDVEEDHSYIANGVAVHNCDAWDRPVLLKSYRTFVGAHNFVEHVQIEEQSKGRIVDAAARDIGDSVYVDILIATDRRHASLIRDIESGRMSTLSMGCSVTETICTKCGNVAADETEMCEHVRYAKGNYEFDAQGRKYRVAELCGHDSLDPTGGVTFIEASWVAVPAFQGAVMRNILEPDQLSLSTQERAHAVLASPPPEWRHPEGQARAARLHTPTVAPSVDVSDEARVAAAVRAGDDFPPMPDAGGAPGAPPAEEKKDPMEDLEEQLEKTLLDRVRKRIEDKMRKEEEDEKPSSAELETSTNENVNHQAALRRRAALVHGADALLRVARSDVELLDGLARLHQSHGLKISRDLYRAVLRVGSTAAQPSLEKYLHRCGEVLGRKPTTGEAKTLVRLGRILSLRKKTRF